jgi:phosphoglycolate phosphatase
MPPGPEAQPRHAAILDLDGTLVDTLGDLSASQNRALGSLGYPTHTMEEFKAMVGNGITRLTMASLPKEDQEEGNALRLRAAFKADYAVHQTDLSRPYPGIGDLLKELSGRGWPLGVLSNKDQENTEAVVGRFFPGVFQAVFGAREGRPIKPDPTAALELAQILGVKPKDVYYFGDSDTDMLLASNAGFVPIGVSWGFRSVEVIRAAGASVVLDAPGDFLRELDSLP